MPLGSSGYVQAICAFLILSGTNPTPRQMSQQTANELTNASVSFFPKIECNRLGIFRETVHHLCLPHFSDIANRRVLMTPCVPIIPLHFCWISGGMCSGSRSTFIEPLKKALLHPTALTSFVALANLSIFSYKHTPGDVLRSTNCPSFKRQPHRGG